MTYWAWLAGLTALFVGLERLAPRDPRQGLVRPGLGTDVFYAVWNGHWLGVVLAHASTPIAEAFDGALASVGVPLHLGLARGWPLAVQALVAFVAIDLVQWGIHRLLHRVPALWELHRVHHSIVHLDVWGSLRFHWGEVVVYKALQYVPLALLGFDGRVLFGIAVVSTAIGHLNHANLDVRFGPLVYLLNGPEMHAWHHAHPAVDPRLPRHGVNFGIDLALWDWLFGTAYLPADRRPPARLGFEGVEAFPADPLRQALAPLRRGAPAGRALRSAP